MGSRRPRPQIRSTVSTRIVCQCPLSRGPRQREPSCLCAARPEAAPAVPRGNSSPCPDPRAPRGTMRRGESGRRAPPPLLCQTPSARIAGDRTRACQRCPPLTFSVTSATISLEHDVIIAAIEVRRRGHLTVSRDTSSKSAAPTTSHWEEESSSAVASLGREGRRRPSSSDGPPSAVVSTRADVCFQKWETEEDLQEISQG